MFETTQQVHIIPTDKIGVVIAIEGEGLRYNVRFEDETGVHDQWYAPDEIEAI